VRRLGSGLRYDIAVKRNLLLAIVGLIVIDAVCVFSWFGIRQHLRTEACKQRGVALNARVESMKQQANAQLLIGTSRDSVIRFLTVKGFHVEVIGNDIRGTLLTTGCAPIGCGTDDALISIRVPIDRDGAVVSGPVVISMYTSCA
jgi:hypothetical protein